jgi:hypothetical protein
VSEKSAVAAESIPRGTNQALMWNGQESKENETEYEFYGNFLMKC